MEQVIISPKYQIVIPKRLRAHSKNLVPGNTVNIKRVDENTYLVKLQPVNWVEKSAGMMTEAWKDIDPIAEIKKSHEEWDERLAELEKEFNR